MNGSSWNLVIPVLVIGLTLGVTWVVWWRQRRTAETRSAARDRELRLADLEARREVLYEQLRNATSSDRDDLELAAARNLRAIEEAGAATTIDRTAPATEEGGAPPPAAPARSSSAWLGFVGGVVAAGLVGLLIVWAQRDAQPKMDGGGAPAPMAQGERHPDGPQMSQRDAEALEQIALQIELDPTDIMARKQYAVGLLSTGQFVGAFEQAEILLASDPDDPDGLYVQGMVRMRMGQEDEARGLLERLVVDYPEHVAALTALGVLVLRSEGLTVAEEYWAQALAATGGRNPEVERLIIAARERFGGEADARRTAASSPPGTSPRAAGTATPVAPGAGASYRVVLDLAKGAQVPSTAVLFAALRAGASGPPIAVKRLDHPSFPLTVTLGMAESMMGQPLPEEGRVVVRLDVDGNASTRQEGEPTAEAFMRLGETVQLTLQ